MQVAHDFAAESRALYDIIAPLGNREFDRTTLFKGWTVNQILRHLYVWNIAADLSLDGGEAFSLFMEKMKQGVRKGRLPDFEADYLDGLSGHMLLSAWIGQVEKMEAAFATVDPKMRVQWVGPDMSAISSITARLMETWAHGQAVYDMLGLVRTDADRIANIVRLGINTFGWTYKNRRRDVPPMPFVRLHAPSGVLWEYGTENDDERVEGCATEFCQVVTQTRNIADTGLTVTGPVAREWMAMAQCFAGPPVDPLAPGVRHRAG